MHPTVVSDKPGTCPVCGMDLVRKARAGEEVEITEDLAKLTTSPNASVVSNIVTVKGEYKKMEGTIRAQGIVTYDTRNIYTIPARIAGRLDKVLVKYPFQQINKGQAVAEIYSPELVNAQRELLFLLENDPSNKALIDGAEDRLSFLGAATSQIEAIRKSKKIQNNVVLYSPYSGYVIPEGNALAAPVSTSPAQQSTGGGMSGGMDQKASSAPVSSNAMTPSDNTSLIREGAYVSSGQTLFKLVNTTSLRVEINLPAVQSDGIDVGNTVQLDFGRGATEKGTIDFVQPFFNDAQPFVTIRAYVKGVSLVIGQLVEATINVQAKESLWFPKESVLDLGTRKIVFVKKRGVFKPQEVTIGQRVNDRIEVIEGLSSSDEIAADAQYMVDSESLIKTP